MQTSRTSVSATTNRLDLSAIKRIHMIGVGGIGMSALARHLAHEGKVVSGSDRSESQITEDLRKLGVHIFPSQIATNITDDIELVIYTEAMSADQEEMVAAKALRVPMVNYFSGLALAFNDYYLVAVAGSHGKTTTTAMLTDILEEADYDPTAIVGSLRTETGSNYRPGKSKYAVVEACEYKRDFLHLEPDVLVITNLEFEHVDYYHDLADVQAAFAELVAKVSETGFIIAPTKNPQVAPVLTAAKATVIDYEEYLDLQLALKQPGMHNRQNAAAAKATAVTIGIPETIASTALENFSGTWRRFEYKGELTGGVGGVPVYDDYGHHPTEITATILAARELYPERQIVVAFQPHTFSRTRELFADFVEALAKADRVYLAPIYAAREEDLGEISSEQLAAAVVDTGTSAQSVSDLESLTKTLREEAGDDNVILVMGAGPITKVATNLTKL